MTSSINEYNSNPDTPPHYEEVIQQDMARAQAGKDNIGYDADPYDVLVHIQPQAVPTQISNMIAVDYPNDPGLGPEPELEKKIYDETEEQMLIVIREVVRRCTHVDPNKRPTAAEMLKLLKTIRVPELERAAAESAARVRAAAAAAAAKGEASGKTEVKNSI